MHALSDWVLDSSEAKIEIFSTVTLHHADVVGCVDAAVARNLFRELCSFAVYNSIEEILQELLMFTFHLNVIDLGHDDSVIVAAILKDEKSYNRYRNQE